jgi:transposase
MSREAGKASGGNARMYKISELKMNLYVRKALDQDHVLYLAELMEGGVDLGPIKVNPDGIVVDGRHRIEATTLHNKDEIRGEPVNIRGEANLIAAAFKANVGGSLPPSREDIEHTIASLIERQESEKNIISLLAMSPSMARKYIVEIRSKLKRAKLQRAADAVTEGTLTVVKAAEQFGVDLDTLREMLSGDRKKNKKGLPELKRQLSTQYKSVSLKNAASLKKILEKYEDGDVTAKQVQDLFIHIDHLQKKSRVSVEGWQQRFAALLATAEKGTHAKH